MLVNTLTNSVASLLDRPGFPKSESVVQIIGDLFPPDEPVSQRIYREPPSPAVDEAWDRISRPGFFILNAEEIQRLGKDPSVSAKAPKQWGYGSNAYLAQVDVFHQIHCLNVLRREANYDYYFKHIYKDGPPSELHKSHFSHCLHILLQNLMCTANVDVYPFVWMETQDQGPFPDFNTRHQCRNFDNIMKWQQENEVPQELYKNHTVLLKPDDVDWFPAPKKLKEWATNPANELPSHGHAG